MKSNPLTWHDRQSVWLPFRTLAKEVENFCACSLNCERQGDMIVKACGCHVKLGKRSWELRACSVICDRQLSIVPWSSKTRQKKLRIVCIASVLLWNGLLFLQDTLAKLGYLCFVPNSFSSKSLPSDMRTPLKCRHFQLVNTRVSFWQVLPHFDHKFKLFLFSFLSFFRTSLTLKTFCCNCKDSFSQKIYANKWRSRTLWKLPMRWAVCD